MFPDQNQFIPPKVDHKYRCPTCGRESSYDFVPILAPKHICPQTDPPNEPVEMELV